MAVAVNGGRTVDETGEDGIDDGFSIRVWARLETSITDVGLANEIELLGKVVTGAVGGVCDGDGEGYVYKAVLGDVGYTPCYFDGAHDEAGQKRDRSGDSEERRILHVCFCLRRY